jgi:hypothetical protein
MADKSPRRHIAKKIGKTLKEKRTAKKLKHKTRPSPFETPDQRRP